MKLKVRHAVKQETEVKAKPRLVRGTPKTNLVAKSDSPIIERDKEVLSLDETLNRLILKAQNIQKNCTDEYVGLKDLSVSPSDLRLNGGSQSLQFTEHSFGQFCTKLGIPTQYMKKCAQNEDTLALVAKNTDTWIKHHNNSKMLLREYGSSLRGFLSEKYSIMDTPEILESLGEVINFDDYVMKGSLLTPERLHLRMAYADNMKVKGEDLFAGLQIDSSDVGRNTLVIQFFVYKQVCTNGLILPKLGGEIFRQKHIGIRPEQFVANLKESLEVLPEVVANAQSLISANKNMMVTNQELKERIVPQIIKDTGLHEEKYSAKIIDLVSHKYKNTNWGVVNAITEVAQDFTLDTRLTLEKYASKWLVG